MTGIISFGITLIELAIKILFGAFLIPFRTNYAAVGISCWFEMLG